MGDKQPNNNNFFQVDADKDLLSDFLNADALNDNDAHIKEEGHYGYESKWASYLPTFCGKGWGCPTLIKRELSHLAHNPCR
jgi:hypothetical protein